MIPLVVLQLPLSPLLVLQRKSTYFVSPAAPASLTASATSVTGSAGSIGSRTGGRGARRGSDV
jgi:hypothetical protein